MYRSNEKSEEYILGQLNEAGTVKENFMRYEYEQQKQNEEKSLAGRKLRQLPTTDDLLDAKYGKEGTLTREAFMKEAYAFYNQINAEAEAEKKKRNTK